MVCAVVAAFAAASVAGACGGSSSGGGTTGGGGAGSGCGDLEGYDCFCDDPGELFAPDCIDGQIVCAECPPGPDTDCGPGVGKTCPAGQHCFFADGQCGQGDAVGICMDAHQDCLQGFNPVCGCDGLVRQDECTANADGVDVSMNGACTIDSNHFFCGASVCDRATDICRPDANQYSEHFPSGLCITLSMCQPLTCACALMHFTDCTCAESADGVVTITCP